MEGRATESLPARRSLYYLIGLNAAVFIAVRLTALLRPEAVGLFAMVELPGQFAAFLAKPWSIATYMFIQYDASHFAVNMLWLYIFGVIAITHGGLRRIWLLYITGGLAGGLAFIATCTAAGYNLMLSGASGAALCIVVAAAVAIPRHRVRLAVFGHVELWKIALLVIIVMVIGVNMTNIGGFAAHLGGMAAGVAAGFKLRRNLPAETGEPAQAHPDKLPPEILDKLRRSGYDSLTADERRQLFESSKKKQQR